MDIDSVLRKVHGLIAKAEHPSTPPKEAAEAQRMADALMYKYKVNRVQADKAVPVAQRMKADKVEIPLVEDPSLVGYMAALARSVARHCDCRIREYSTFRADGWHSRIYGYQSDLSYYQILYAELRLQMVGALRPKYDPAKSIDLNAYLMHNAGMNWFDMAQMEGWRQVPPEFGEPKVMYINDHTGQRQKWSDAVGKFKDGYKREIELRGEPWMQIPPGGMNTFRVNAANGYVVRIEQRLARIREGREVGTTIALLNDAVDALFKEDNPELYKPIESSAPKGRRTRAPKVRHIPYSAQGYESGVRQANAAALDPSPSHTPRKEL
jgi:hypothetical protein